MIVDTSALLAILRDEPEASAFAEVIAQASVRRISAASFVEAAAVIDSSRSPIASHRFDDFLLQAELVIEPVTVALARIAREASRDYGKGSGHSANLNLGDCFSYALARATGEPLLFQGDDFSHTDIRPAHT